MRPLAQRLLTRLPGPRFLWVAIWALVPWMNAAANLALDTGQRSAVWEQSDLLVVLNYFALSVAIAVALLGEAHIIRRFEDLRAAAARVFAAGNLPETTNPLAPAVGAVATAVAFGLSALLEDGWLPGIVRAATWVIVGVAIWSFVTTYVALQLRLRRLGRAAWRADARVVDPSLSLRPFGAVAFTAFWLFLLALVPVLVTGFPDVVGFVLGLLVLVAGVAAFVLSLRGLHRKIVDAKEVQLDLARALYAEAYEPVRTERTLEALERQHSLLGAADALEKRARAIHDWPVAEGTWAWVIGIATSVVAVACARLLLRPLGF